MFRKIYNYYFSPHRTFVRALTQILGFVPKYLHFYNRAFTHKSMSKTTKHSGGRFDFNNERLEFLGDAVLDAVTAEYLFRKYPAHDEGFLTQMRSKLVNRKTLNNIASTLGLDVFLRQFGANHVSQTMLGNTFEAFVGAIYLDVGYRKTRYFIINKILLQLVDLHKLENTNSNYKSRLLEYCQKNQHHIEYKVLNQYRTKKNRERFKIAVFIDGEERALAEDFSKKGAEQTASQKTLERLGLLRDSNK